VVRATDRLGCWPYGLGHRRRLILMNDTKREGCPAYDMTYASLGTRPLCSMSSINNDVYRIPC
jgi:hypothetical protein